MGLQDEDEDEERGEDVDENLMRACARVWCSKTVGGSSQKHCLKRARAHQLSLAISKIAKSVGGLFKIKLGRLENDENAGGLFKILNRSPLADRSRKTLTPRPRGVSVLRERSARGWRGKVLNNPTALL